MSLNHFLRLIGIVLATVTALLAAHASWGQWRSWRAADAGSRALADLGLGLVAAERVSRERGPTNARLGALDGTPDPQAVAALAKARESTDQAMAQLRAMLAARSQAPHMGALLAGADDTAQALARARAAADEVIALPHARRTPEAVRASVYGLVAIVPRLAPVNSALIQAVRTAQPSMDGDTQVLRITAELREHAGLLGSHFTAALAKQRPFTAEERNAIEQTRGRIMALQFLLEQRLARQDAPPDIAEAWEAVDSGYFGHAARDIVAPVLAAGERDGRYGITAAQFAERYVPELGKVVALRDRLMARLQTDALAARERALHSLVEVVGVSALLWTILAGTLAMLHARVLRPLAQTTRALQDLARNRLDAPLPRPAADDEIAAVIGAVRALQEHTQSRQVLERERDGLIAQLREQSLTDFLTGLPNRRAFFAAARERIAQARQQRFDVTLMLLDVDLFKSFNDRAGHAAGDEALRAVARAVRNTLRPGDLVARHGGEEFVVLLGPCAGREGAACAERLRHAIEMAPVVLPSGERFGLTASVGVAVSQRHGLVLDHLLSEADTALYRAKDRGRNRVEEAA
ncbi:GGDEF domain-containing protein [Paracidovorax cattleyae]|uniref:diguanylate cyclase n=2 Tax=Paracidovorax cattleyae TaxID=80868 RepID=A0A1H0WGZ3_9BURK|nr:GGDEF domain-containing protein [Paracidovorax cattleyae]AVS76146.1 HAMP domain-containing protein [Paracidovorax cattleyae]SDP89868.1 diguanylate cyclase (GGDEF) domain-containing protein [Paracidovorax cattleyae]